MFQIPFPININITKQLSNLLLDPSLYVSSIYSTVYPYIIKNQLNTTIYLLYCNSLGNIFESVLEENCEMNLSRFIQVKKSINVQFQTHTIYVMIGTSYDNVLINIYL